MSAVRNFNIGILGHVDSGKTSIAKIISTQASTAAFDKNPQSLERGITLDLGFSSFNLHIDEQIKEIQVTLVDCPGHSSLIKTVIGGAQIMNAALLIIDANKGIQTQTAECIVLAEVLKLPLIVVINKTDLLDPKNKSEALKQAIKSVRKSLKTTIFCDSECVPFSAKLEDETTENDNFISHLMSGIRQIAKSQLSKKSSIGSTAKLLRSARTSSEFLFAYEHCFNLKGRGTILTGTLLKGILSIDDDVQVLPSGVNSKVKSIQRFRQPVNEIHVGDRAGICLSKVNPDEIERGFVATRNSVKSGFACIVKLSIVKYYQSNIKSHTLFHVSIGYETVLAKAVFIERVTNSKSSRDQSLIESEYRVIDEIDSQSSLRDDPNLYVYLGWERQVFIPENTLIIGSKLDTDKNTKSCRLAFYGNELFIISEKINKNWSTSSLKLFKNKEKTGVINRIIDEKSLIGTGMFGESSILPYLGFKIDIVQGDGSVIATGTVDSKFGKGEKFKVIFPTSTDLNSLLKSSNNRLKATRGSAKEERKSGSFGNLALFLKYRKFVNEKSQVDQNF